MSKAILELKRIWNKEKESYVTQEVGSGVQGFVKRVLECPDIFNLKAGALSAPDEKRKNEFIYEKRTKQRRRADFTIYINSEIVIPVEKGACVDYPKAAVPYEITDGQLVMNGADLITAYEDTLNPGWP